MVERSKMQAMEVPLEKERKQGKEIFEDRQAE